jgi:cytochrome c oxidase assembly protein subunit 11
MTNHDTSKQARPAPRLTRDALVAAICGLVVVLMVGASYAAVPFYNWFCRATGFNGTTQVATSAPATGPIARKVSVRFDSNVAGGLPWRFEPEQTEIEIPIGEKREMPVVFYVDPSIVSDHDNDTLNTITLSYTFYPVRDPAQKPVAASENDRRKGNL